MNTKRLWSTSARTQVREMCRTGLEQTLNAAASRRWIRRSRSPFGVIYTDCCEQPIQFGFVDLVALIVDSGSNQHMVDETHE